SKVNDVSFEHNFAGAFADEGLRQALRHGGVHERFLPQHEQFWNELDRLYKTSYRTESFHCVPGDATAAFSVLNDHKPARLLPGGALLPLNHLTAADQDFIVLKEGERTPYL